MKSKKSLRHHSTKTGHVAKSTKPSKPHFYGTHAVKALLNYRPQDVLSLFVQIKDDGSCAHEALVAQAHALDISVQQASKEALHELCGSHQHQGIVAATRLPSMASEALLDDLLAKESLLLLVLDQITDAHNLGACLRSACAMGVDAVIVPKNQSAPITPTVAKVSVGASEIIPVISVTNLARTLQYIKSAGVFVFGTTLDDVSQPVHACDFLGRVAIVMGSEGEGMRRLTREHCDTLVYIPMTDTNHRPQSLNVSVATGIMLYEVMRQRTMDAGR